jgi:hypothetical protein
METETKLDTKSSLKNAIFYTIFFLLLIGSIVVTYVKIVVNKNYQIVAETSCDPVNEKCFVWECDIEIDGECSDVAEENVFIYKIINKKASSIALCEASDEKLGCNEELTCTEGEENCSYEYCNEESLTDGIRCSDESDVQQEQVLDESNPDALQEIVTL